MAQSRWMDLSLEVDARAAHELIAQDPAAVLLDVREPHEFAAGHIEGAKLIPLGQLESRLAELPANRPVLCICRSGARSLTATRRLQVTGRIAKNLRGGMLGWAEAGLPIRRGAE